MDIKLHERKRPLLANGISTTYSAPRTAQGHVQALQVLHILSVHVPAAANAIKRLSALGVSVPDVAAASGLGFTAKDLDKLD